MTEPKKFHERWQKRVVINDNRRRLVDFSFFCLFLKDFSPNKISNGNFQLLHFTKTKTGKIASRKGDFLESERGRRKRWKEMETTRNKRSIVQLDNEKMMTVCDGDVRFSLGAVICRFHFLSSPGCVRAHLILFSFLSFFQSPITIDTISFRGSGPLIDGQRSRNFRPRWPSFECDLPACPTCRHAR